MKESFNDVYTRLYKENYEELEVLRKKSKKTTAILLVAFMIFFFLATINPILLILFIVLLIVWFAISVSKRKKWKKRTKLYRCV